MTDIKSITRAYLTDLKKTLNKINLDDIQKVANILFKAYKNDNTVFILGVGGAASTSSHMACDLGKGTLQNVYNPKEKRLRVISLTDNVAKITAFANDLSFDDVFVQQLKNLVRMNDVVIGISGSGNTPNVIKALMYAKDQGATTIGLLGFKNGGKARDFVDYNITIQSTNYGIVEDAHLALNHLLTASLSYMKERLMEENAVGNSEKKNGLNKKFIAAEWIERSARR